MAGARTFEIASELAEDGRVVLAHAATWAGVDDELRPLQRMTAGPFRGRSLFEARTGEPLFRSWLLLGGILPVDFDHLRFERLDPDSGFVEVSTMASISEWRHERRVTDLPGGGCRVVDRLSFRPRLPGTGAALARLVALVFRHRHRRLRARYGDASAPRAAPSAP